MKNILLIHLVFFLASCSDQGLSGAYCKHLVKLAKKPTTVTMLKNWVDENVINTKFTPTNTILGGGLWPGRYHFPVEFSWELLNFDPNMSEVRLVGPSFDDEDDGSIDEIKSVFFGERSRYGILIRVPNGEGFGVDDKYLVDVSPRVAVVCLARD